MPEPKLKTVPTTKAEEVAESLNAIEGELCGLSGTIECIMAAMREGHLKSGEPELALCLVSDRISALRGQIGNCVDEIRK